MTQYPGQGDSNWKELYTTLKFLVLLICIIPTLQKWFDAASKDELVFFNIAKMIIFFLIITLTATFWFVINYAFKNERMNSIFEIIVMYGVCLFCYYSTGTYLSNYKFVFALVILLYAIDFGMKFSMLLSIAAGGTIIVSDLINCPDAMRTQCFQSDVLLLGAFCMTAYTVSYYAEKNRQLIQVLSDAVHRDSLTGLHNHRRFYDFMRVALETSYPDKKQYIMIMDIDYFKMYNDNLGHQKGDTALCEIAKICREIFEDEHVFRYGGEEFSIYTLAKDDEDALVIANRLRTAIENHPFYGRDMQPGNKLTVSIGIAGKKDSNDTVADWVERADNALYKAKAFQKNRAQMYSSVYDRFDHLDLVEDNEQIISILRVVG